MSTTPSSPEDLRALGATLIETFGKGWSRCNADTIVSVFTPDGRFLATPFTPALEGVEAIRGYWKDLPYNQSEVSFTGGEIFTVGPWFATEFKCTFRRRRSGEWVDARGAIFCETQGNLISEMRMYWHRWSGGREI